MQRDFLSYAVLFVGIAIVICAILEMVNNPRNLWAGLATLLVFWIWFRQFFPPKKIKDFQRFVMPEDKKHVDNRKIRTLGVT